MSGIFYKIPLSGDRVLGAVPKTRVFDFGSSETPPLPPPRGCRTFATIRGQEGLPLGLPLPSGVPASPSGVPANFWRAPARPSETIRGPR